MTCRPGDLVFIPFPYSDLSSSKKRPVLVLATPDKRGDFIVLAGASEDTATLVFVLPGILNNHFPFTLCRPE